MELEDAKPATFRDWDGLPPDLLRSIAEALDVPSCIWFRAVCRSWRAAFPAMQPPCLVIPDCGYPADYFAVISLPTRACSSWTIPGSRCVGSSGGWLALLDPHMSVTLMNPLTHAQLRLPPLRREGLLYPCRDQIKSDGSPGYFRAGSSLLDKATNNVQDKLIQKPAFSANPNAQDHAVAALCRYGLGLAFKKAGLDDWQWLNWPDAAGGVEPSAGERHGASNTDLDIVYHDGKFYYMTLCGQIWTFDADAPSPVTPTPLVKCRAQLGPDHRRYGKHLVFTDDGVLHVVWSDGPGIVSWEIRDRPMRMHVQSYHPGSSRHRRWRTARHLSGRAFLIGTRSHSLAVPAAVASAPSTWVKPNCIYFTCIMPGSDYIMGIESKDCLPQEIWEFNVTTGVFKACNTRDIPDSGWLEWSKAIWFTPSL